MAVCLGAVECRTMNVDVYTEIVIENLSRTNNNVDARGSRMRQEGAIPYGSAQLRPSSVRKGMAGCAPPSSHTPIAKEHEVNRICRPCSRSTRYTSIALINRDMAFVKK